MPGTVKEAIIKEIRTNETVTKQELAAQYKMHIGTLERIIKQGTGKTFRSLRPGGELLRHDRLSQQEKETIVAEIQAKKATMSELAQRYRVSLSAIGNVFKRMTGKTYMPQKAGLSQTDRKAIVAALQSGKTTEKEKREFDIISLII